MLWRTKLAKVHENHAAENAMAQQPPSLDLSRSWRFGTGSAMFDSGKLWLPGLDGRQTPEGGKDVINNVARSPR